MSKYGENFNIDYINLYPIQLLLCGLMSLKRSKDIRPTHKLAPPFNITFMTPS